MPGTTRTGLPATRWSPAQAQRTSGTSAGSTTTGTTVPARHGRDRDLGWRGVPRMNTQELAAAIASTQ